MKQKMTNDGKRAARLSREAREKGAATTRVRVSRCDTVRMRAARAMPVER
jgi:hypothetical protein